MKMKKIFTLVIAMAVMVSASAFAQNNNYRNDNEGRPQRLEQRDGRAPQSQRGEQDMKQAHKKGGLDMSKLSEVQRNEIKELDKKYNIELSNLSLDIKKQDNVIKSEMLKDSPSKSAIDTAIDAKSGLQAQREKLRFEKRLAVGAIISPASN